MNPRARRNLALLLTLIVILALLGGMAGKMQAVCISATNGLSAWWPGESNALDIIGNQNLNVYGGVTYTDGKAGTCFDFNGSTAYLATTPSGITFPGPLTVEMWINFRTNPGGMVMAAKGADANLPVDWAVGISSNNKLRLHATINGIWYYFDCTTTLTSNTWYHAAMIFDQTNLCGYINGVLDGSEAYPGTLAVSTNAFRIGAYAPASGVAFFPGRIDEVSLYNRALSTNEVCAIYLADASGKCPVPATIVVQPANRTNIIGETVTLTAVAAGTTPKYYQWLKAGFPLLDSAHFTGTDSNNLTIADVTLGDAGDYQLTVTNLLGSATSQVARVTVLCPTLRLLTSPTNKTAPAGGDVTFSASASGNTLNYQWQSSNSLAGWTATIGATNPSYALSAVTTNQNGTLFRCAITSACNGAVTNSAAAGLTVTSPQCRTTSTNAVSWWPGESNTLDVVSGFDGIAHGGLTFTSGKVGSSFSFNGTDAYLETASNPMLTFTMAFTVEGWVNYVPSTNDTWYTIVTKGQDAEVLHDWTLLINGNTGKLRAQAMMTTLDGSAVLSPLAWSHVALTYDGTAMRLYVNGLLDASFPTSGSLPTSGNPVFLGAYAPVNGSGSKAFFQGKLDELTLYGRALSGTELAAIYTAGINGKCAVSPVCYNTSFLVPLADVSINEGDTATFSANAFGSHLSYQWQTNHGTGWTNVNGATSFDLNLFAPGSLDGLLVRCRTTGSGCNLVTTNTREARLTVSCIPVTADNPTSIIQTRPGSNLTFSITATGRLPSYQWQMSNSLSGWTAIAGATDTNYSLTVTPGLDGARFRCRVTSACDGQVADSAETLVRFWLDACLHATSNLVSWWPGESNALDWVNGHNGTLKGGVTFAPGHIGNSFVFNGEDSLIEIPSTPKLKPTNSLTVEAWINPSSDWENTVFSKGNAANSGLDWALYVYDGGNLSVRCTINGVFHEFQGPAELENDTWYHVAMTYDGNTVALYVNGNLDYAAACPGTLSASDQPLLIGAYEPPYGDLGYFDGAIDEPAYYDRALSADEIRQIFLANEFGRCTGTGTAPTITSPPASTTNHYGSDTMFAVTVQGDFPLTYQWTFNGTNLPGQISSTLPLADLAFSNAGDYAVIVSNAIGTVTSAPAHLSVICLPLLLIASPTNQTVAHGLGASFSVTATGNQLTYQWQSSNSLTGWTAIADATNTTYSLATVTTNQNGALFRCVISPSCGDATNSAAALLTVTCPPLLLAANPTNQTVLHGTGASFSVSATGNQLTYQWQSSNSLTGWTAITDATNTTYSLTANINLNGTQFRCVISPSCGDSTNSAAATLTVTCPPVQLLTNPTNQTVLHGTGASFSVSATGSQLTYQWQSSNSLAGWTAIVGATNTTCSLASVTTNQSGTLFRCVISPGCGDGTNTAAALLTVNCLPPQLTANPTNQTVAHGMSASFSVGATGNQLAYQWQSSNSLAGWTTIAGATNTTYSLATVTTNQSGTLFRCILSSGCSDVATNSGAALLTVTCPPLLLLASPTNQTLLQGMGASFSVSATGNQLAYQWQSSNSLAGWTAIAGATNTIYSLAPVTTNQSGTLFRCVLSPGCGDSTNSAAAALTVFPPACTSTPSNSVAWWPGEGDTREAVANLPTTALGDITYATGKVGNCFDLNGTNAYLSTSATNASFSGPLSIEMWINFRSVTANGSMMAAKGADSGQATDWAFGISSDNKLRLHASISGFWRYFDCATTLSTGVWYHVAMTYNQTNLSGYVNGALDGSQSYPGTIKVTANPLRLGVYGLTPAVAYFSGLMDEPALYQRALTAAEIAAIYVADARGKCALDSLPPAFISQPASRTNIIGTSANLSALAGGTAPLSYQWSKDSSPLLDSSHFGGTTNSTLTITGVVYEDNGDYQLVVSNPLGSVTSQVARLTVPCPLIQLTQIPTNQTVSAGNPATFTVNATGLQLTYQWQASNSLAGWTAIADATNTSYGLATTTINQNGTLFRCVITTGCDGSTSNSPAATLAVVPDCRMPTDGKAWWPGEDNAVDVVRLLPDSLNGGTSFSNGVVGRCFNFNGTNAYLNASATNVSFSGPLTVEMWFNYRINTNGNGIMLAAKGADTSTSIDWAMGVSPSKKLRVHATINGTWYYFDCNTTLTSNTWYHAAMTFDQTNLCGYINGVLDGSQSHPGTLAVTTNSFRLGVYAPTPKIAFFPGLIDEPTLYNRVLPADELAKIYLAAGSGKCLLGSPGPGILGNPTSRTNELGTSTTFQVFAYGTSPLVYQWSFNGTNLLDGTNYFLTLTNIQPANAGSYQVTVSNGYGNLTSSPASLSIGIFAPIFAVQPANRTAPAGTNITLTSLVTNTTVVAYQWFFGNTPILNATNASLTLSNIQFADQGPYNVQASNVTATVFSSNATLTVLLPPFNTTTLPATELIDTNAFLNAIITPFGLPTLAWLEVGDRQGYNMTVGLTNIPAGVSTFTLRTQFTLIPGVTYHYRVAASNAAGVYRGRDLRFATPVLTLRGASTLTYTNGVGSFTDPRTDVTASPLAITATSSFGYDAFLLKADGSVNILNISYDPNATSMAIITTNGIIRDIYAGNAYVLLMTTNNTAYTWYYGSASPGLAANNAVAGGASPFSSLGATITTQSNIYSNAFGLVTCWVVSDPQAPTASGVPVGLTNAISVYSGSKDFFALLNNGGIVAWTNAPFSPNTNTSLPTSLYSHVSQVAAGYSHNLALKDDGSIIGWGSNIVGELTIPANLTKALAVAAGRQHSLALRTDGSLAVWGTSNYGQNIIPDGATNIVAIAHGDSFCLALRADGRIFQWGSHLGAVAQFPTNYSIYSTLRTNLAAATNSFNTNAPGTYTMSYRYTNVLGGVGTATRTLIVVRVASHFTAVTVQNGNGADQHVLLSFTNDPGRNFTMLGSPNVALPVTQWTELGAVTEVSPGQYQFIAAPPTNSTPLYFRLRSP